MIQSEEMYDELKKAGIFPALDQLDKMKQQTIPWKKLKRKDRTA